MSAPTSCIRWFRELSLTDLPLVGGKNASLGEMFQQLAPLGVRIPDGFAVTAEAYRDALDEADAWAELHRAARRAGQARRRPRWRAPARAAREIVYGAPHAAPRSRRRSARPGAQLKAQFGEDLSVAVRSSATAEDLPDRELRRPARHLPQRPRRGACCSTPSSAARPRCSPTGRSPTAPTTASTTSRSTCRSAVMQMVRSDLASSGVMFTHRHRVGPPGRGVHHRRLGPGRERRAGRRRPGRVLRAQADLRARASAACCAARWATSRCSMVYAQRPHARAGGQPADAPSRPRALLPERRRRAGTRRRGDQDRGPLQPPGRQPRPMDIEWAKDGPDGAALHRAGAARDRRSRSARRRSSRSSCSMAQAPCAGTRPRASARASPAGRCARVARCARRSPAFKPGEVLVADTTTPDWEPVMKTAAAIVTNRGGRTCHAAIVARELGIPAVVGAEHATEVLRRRRDGDRVAAPRATMGKVYAGALPFRRRGQRPRAA